MSAADFHQVLVNHLKDLRLPTVRHCYEESARRAEKETFARRTRLYQSLAGQAAGTGLLNLITFQPDGTFIGFASDGNRSPTTGLWLRVGDRKFLQTSFLFNFNENRALTTVTKVRVNVQVLDKNASGSEVSLIHELVDLRLIHLVRSRITVSKRAGKIFEGYMLDVSQYTGSRKRHNFELVEFWKPEALEELRRVKLIYEPTNSN